MSEGFEWLLVLTISSFFFSVANFCILLTPNCKMRAFCRTFPDVCREKFWSTFWEENVFWGKFHHISTEFLVWWQFFTSFFHLIFGQFPRYLSPVYTQSFLLFLNWFLDKFPELDWAH
jgi:hypothetical protein